MEQYQYKLGPITIHFPNEDQNNFSIFEDLAELFGKDYQAEAVKLLRSKLKDIKPKPSIDYESDNISITTSNPGTLLSAINAIIELSDEENKKSFPEIDLDKLKTVLENAKKNKPKPKKWEKGDVFAIRLSDNTFSIGQVIDKQYHCTCALFPIRTGTIPISQTEFKNYEPVSIMHMTDSFLNNGRWQILFNEQVTLNPSDGSGGRYGEIGSKSYSPGTMCDLANAYWGLQPWNTWFDEKYLDKLLLKEIPVPGTALILNEAERQKYRKEKLGII